MISKLRRKFIIVAMLSVTVVLTVLIAAINIFNFMKVIRDADNVLTILTENHGEFPQDPMPDSAHDDMPGDRMNNGGRRKDQMSPEMRFEARFFSITLDGSGSVLSVDTGRIAAVDSSRAEELAESVFKSGKTKGFLNGYRFERSDAGDEVLIVFYDCGRSLDNARSFLGISIMISAAGLLIVFALIALSSKAVIRPAAEAYEKQKRFITDAGHELKTPLAVINADCDVLDLENDGGDNEWIADIRKQTERLTALTNDLIYLAKTEEGAKSDMVRIDFPLSDLVSEETESFKGLAKASGKTIETEIADGISFNGDQKAITQLISILLDNAIKYSPEGGTIRVALNATGTKTVLSVSNDTTQEFTKENFKRMFDRFYRTDGSRNSETGGHGIGLSIAKGITESHGGRIFASGSEKKITITAEL